MLRAYPDSDLRRAAWIDLRQPTQELVAGVYGMNFHRMPELEWSFGYPMALGLIVASAVLPLVWFKRRGWI